MRSPELLPGEAALDPEQGHQLRQLRFPRELEVEFDRQYAADSLGYVRFALCVSALVVSLMGIPPALAGNQSDLFFRFGGMVPVLLLGLGATFLPIYRRRMQPLMAGLCLSFGVLYVLNMRAIPVATAALAMFHLVLGIAALSRLRVIWATGVTVSVTGLYLVQAALHDANPFPFTDVDQYYPALLVALLFGVVAGIFQERSARRDFLLRRLLEQEREKAEELLLNILPRDIAARLKTTPGTIAEQYAEVTVLFADLVDFSHLAARRGPVEVVDLLNRIFSEFDELAEQHGMEKIKTIGDAYMAVAGLPQPQPNHAEAAAEMALDMLAAVERVSAEKGVPLSIRIGLNSGPVVAGVIGRKKFIYDLWGDTVNMASRMETHGVTGGIQVSAETRRRLGERYQFEHRPGLQIKGRGEMDAYLLVGRRPVEVAA
ncbi:MAG: adenylate/guanylate cyclase domain-containing protein [Armatimonadota bacterium]